MNEDVKVFSATLIGAFLDKWQVLLQHFGVVLHLHVLKLLRALKSPRSAARIQFHLFKAHCSKSSFFVQNFNFDFPRKLSIFWGWKTRENIVVFDFLAVDNFDFTRKIVKKNLGEKLVKIFGFCQNWIFGQKFDFSNSVFFQSLLLFVEFATLYFIK